MTKNGFQCDRCKIISYTDKNECMRTDLPDGWIETINAPTRTTQHFCPSCVDAYKKFLAEGVNI